MTEIHHRSNPWLVTRFQRLMEYRGNDVRVFVAEGLGHMTINDMRAAPRCHRLVPKYLERVDECTAILAEAKARYGPDLRVIEDLHRLSQRRRRCR